MHFGYNLYPFEANMLCCDTLKLKAERVPLYRPDGFTQVQRQDPDRDPIRWQESNNPALGIKRILIRGAVGDEYGFELEVSAKALLDGYPDLISLNTLERLSDNLNSTGLVSVTPDFLTTTTVCRADVTSDLRLTEHPDQYLQALHTLRGAHRFDFRARAGSVAFKTRVDRGADRLSIYDKQRELSKAKNRDLLSVAPSLFNRFAGTLRVETQCQNYASIRRAMGSPDTKGVVTLARLLESEHKPNYSLLREIRDSSGAQELFDDFESSGLKLYQYEKMKGRRQILLDLGCDFDLLRAFLKQALNGKPSRYVKEYRQVYEYMIAENDVIQYGVTRARLDEIEQALAVAA